MFYLCLITLTVGWVTVSLEGSTDNPKASDRLAVQTPAVVSQITTLHCHLVDISIAKASPPQGIGSACPLRRRGYSK